MKLLNNIYLALVALLMVGCELDPLESDITSSDDVILSLGITTKATTDSNSLFDSEDEIKTLRVYAFDSGVFDRMELFGTPQDVYEMEVKRSKDKDLYFIVNEPAELSDDLDLIKSVGEVKAFGFTIAQLLNSSNSNGFNGAANPVFSMPMSSTVTGIDASLDRTIEVSVDRCVARVDLYIKMGDLYSNVTLSSSTSFEVSGIHDDVTALAGVIPDAYRAEDKVSATGSDQTLSKDNQTRVLSFYAAERTYDFETTPITITANGITADAGSMKFSVTLGDTDDKITSTLSQIKRNTIYRINVTFGVKDIVQKVNYQIIKWDKVDIDGDMGGVILVSDDVIAMDWFRNNYSYTAPVGAFGGDRKVEIFVPQSRNDNGTFNYSETPQVTLDPSDGTRVTNILGGTNYDDFIKWIASAQMTTNSLAGQIEVTYTPQDIAYEYESFPIRIKCENVIKTMNVIYDNGYIPQKNIPSQSKIDYLENVLKIDMSWITTITNGMVLAKRGKSLHPARTEDIIEAKKQSDGSYLYVGEHSMTGAEAQNYCKTLGEKWYLPNVELLQMVQLKGRELGTSYRFQNTDEAYYWSSTPGSTAGTYMAVPMSKSKVNQFLGSKDPADWAAIAPVEVDESIKEDANNRYYVRCILNL